MVAMILDYGGDRTDMLVQQRTKSWMLNTFFHVYDFSSRKQKKLSISL